MSDATSNPNDQARRTVRRFRVIFLLQGALLILAGAVALISPLFATVMLTLILGWTLLATGIVQAVTALVGRSHHFWPQLISAALAFFIGLIMIRNPEVAVTALVLIFIIFFMIEGIAKIVFALSVRPMTNWLWVLLSGLLAVVLSLWLFSNPLMSLWVIGAFIGIQLIAEGVAIGGLAWIAKDAV